MSVPNHNQAFEEARNEFLASLSPKERAVFTKCPSPDQLVDDVKNLSQGKKDRSWGRRVIASISSLADSLQPYFDTIGTFVSSHPEYAAIVWGAFRLIFQLANNYASFFTKLTKALDRITQTLPQYTDVAKLCAKNPSKRLQSSLVKVYQDLLRFCQAVTRIFAKEDGTAKKAPRIMTSLFWKPFDARFEDLLDDFRFHADLVKVELLLADFTADQLGRETVASNITEINNRLKKAEKARQASDGKSLSDEAKAALEKKLKDQTRTKMYEIQRWIFPPEFAQELERAQDQRESGTTEWLFDEDLVKSWLVCQDSSDPDGKNFGERAIWVQGNPGCGKTVLAASTVEELRLAGKRGGLEPQVFYFFFRAGFSDLCRAIAPLRSFVAQLFHSKNDDQDIIDRFAFIMEEQSSGQLSATRNELLDLLQLSTDHAGGSFFILDGLDECEDPAMVARDLLTLTCDSGVKTIIFSRPNVGCLFKSVPEEQRLNIGRKNGKDIETYVSAKLDEFVDENMLPSDIDTSTLSEHLILGADGMFLWIRLMLNYLNSPALTRRKRAEAIMNVNVPEGLDSIYDRIMHLIDQSNAPEKDLACRVFTWLLHSRRPLATRELQVAVSAITSADPDEEDEFQFPQFVRAVILSCGGLVEAQETYSPSFRTKIQSFQFIHLSVTEYLVAQESTSNTNPGGNIRSQILPSTPDMHIQIANQCLLILSYRLPSQPLSGSLNVDITPSQIHQPFPFVGYCCCHWIDHLGTLDRDYLTKEMFPQLLQNLSKFFALQRTLMAYIQTSYVFRVVPRAELLKKWIDVLLLMRPLVRVDGQIFDKVVDDGQEFARYLTCLDKDWGTELLSSPKSIWEETTAFTSSRLIAQTSATAVTSLIMDAPRSESVSSRYLSKISELSEDGKMVGVLSIWPSKAFEQQAQSSMRPIESMIHLLCTGWVARYELWAVTGEPTCTVDGSIPLDANEIHLQLQRSLWQDDPTWAAGQWRLQFPMAISPNVRIISIIRTVYLFTVTPQQEARMQAVQLPLHFEPYLAAIWPAPPKHSEPQPTRTDSERREGKSSIRDFLRPGGSRHARTRSVSPGRTPLLEPEKTEAKRTRFWSRSFSRSKTPNDLTDSIGSGFGSSRQYRYWISFAGGSFLLFLDHPQDLHDRSHMSPSTIALFKIHTQDALRVTLFAKTKDTICPNIGHLPAPKVLFHPQEPLVSFFFPRANNGPPVVLWAYSQSSMRPLSVYIPSDFVDEAVDNVHFSNCGQYLVIQTNQSSVPEVIPIDSDLLSAHQTTQQQATLSASPSSTALTINPKSGPVLHLPGSSSTTFTPETSITPTGEAVGLSIVHTGTEISIRKWSNDTSGSDKEDVLKLTKLPAWQGLQTSSVAVKRPEDGDGKVKIVLNKSARQWEDMTTEVDMQLPALVSRDASSLMVERREGRRLEG
ncbi:hypothetical protein EJ04DRAFT_572652 [Polyplosphaeria fusca]|uniref:NACHT domain-containing protein n=1 Tax=Polyplosphaeria fusca TaxID=682080 RepID=A0A9P4V6K4_9PLEO|nr:hypothetical protein EJ04DRAFT_572652 [Polyplosphaeria fusca]